MEHLHMPTTDNVTGLADHSAFQQYLQTMFEHAEELQTGFSLTLVDIDHFQEINTRLGYAAGDEILKTIARSLQQNFPEHNSVYRIGGDEFVILLPDVEKEQVLLRFEELRKALDQEHVLMVNGTAVRCPLAISIGIAAYPDDGNMWQDVLRKAKDAIYRAKMTGRNKVCIAREERMVTKTSHYTQGQLERLAALAKKEGVGEAVLLREALDDVLHKYDA
jgi:diguanylate cyclase (GGDEF)-like protein